MTDDQLVEQNIALGVQADAIRDQRRALVAELRARHAKRDIEAAVRRALGDAASVVVEGQTVTVNLSTEG
jgi:hypothetical protein